jgi:hypothetical protein
MNRIRNYTLFALCASRVLKTGQAANRSGLDLRDKAGTLLSTREVFLGPPPEAMTTKPVKAHSKMRRNKGEKIIMKMALVGPLALLLVCCGAFRTQAQDLSQEEKDRALEYLESTKKGVLDATKVLSEAQWNFKPAPDRWSVAEVLEHIAAAEDMLRGMTQEQVMKSTAVPARDAAETKKADEAVLAVVPDRSHKAQAPEPLRPTNRFGSPLDA